METFFERKWLGVPMYWSSFDSKTNKRLLEDAGLKVLSAREITEKVFGKLNTFLWVIAQKPGWKDNITGENGATLIRLLNNSHHGAD